MFSFYFLHLLKLIGRNRREKVETKFNIFLCVFSINLYCCISSKVKFHVNLMSLARKDAVISKINSVKKLFKNLSNMKKIRNSILKISKKVLFKRKIIALTFHELNL